MQARHAVHGSHRSGATVSGPIKPADVTDLKKISIPEVVFEAFNELIVENFNGSEARVLQMDVLDRILFKSPSLDRDIVFRNGWLNIEDVYRGVGWVVGYDKPTFDETFLAHFTFKKRSP